MRRRFRHLRTVVHTTGREKLEKFIEIFQGTLDPGDRRGAASRSHHSPFRSNCRLASDRGDIGELERLLRTIRRLTGPDDRVIRENVLAIEHIVEHWSAQTFIDRVTIGLKKEDFHYVLLKIAICRLLSNRAAPHLARVAGRLGR